MFDLKYEPPEPVGRSARSETKVFSNRQATCAGVVLQKVKDLPAVCHALMALEPLPEEDADRLLELMELVEGKEGQQLLEISKKACQSIDPPLRAIEVQLLPLVRVDRARARLQLARIGSCTQVQAETVQQDAGTITDAAKQVCQSSCLQDIVRAALSLRDYMKLGPEALRSDARAPEVMDISSLISGLKEFKAAAPGAQRSVTLLHFFVHSLLRVRPDIHTCLEQELSMLPSACRSSWPGIRDMVAQLDSDAKFVAEELRSFAETYGEPGSQERNRLSDLASAAGSAAAMASEAMASADAALRDLARYFGLKSSNQSAQDMPGLALLRQLVELQQGLHQACIEVLAADGTLGCS
eukprot:TRINITY_DN6649_c0_g2_i1.p1 TRINITY_DN6649_c0_g2~~TRINITY_DN6649_c0_g2_i1.p1  ORF type:complete len:355 (+),score=102.69 TRINITY_DN6649_c0_g2_i1:1183-2247(+)